MFGEILFEDANASQRLKFKREADLIKAQLGDLVQGIADFGGVVAGGAVTSVFTNKEINDIDLYFPDAKRASQFVAAVYSKEFGFHQFVNATNKCLMFTSRDTGAKFQLIYYKFHPTIEDIFYDFDFTINMGAYDPKTDSFVLHDDFMRHNSQRTIQINTNTAYPLISVLRTQKYKERGYHVSKPQLVRLLLSITQLGITGWKELKDQLGGMYGYNVDDLFPEKEEFSLEKALDVIDALNPKILEVEDFKSMDMEDIQKAVVDIFPKEFQDVERGYYRHFGTIGKEPIEFLDYAYPKDVEPTTKKFTPTQNKYTTTQKYKEALQDAFEAWLVKEKPYGDHEQVQRKWEDSDDYHYFLQDNENPDQLPF